jgi:hypothetical protein
MNPKNKHLQMGLGSVAHLQSQLFRRQKLEGSRFKTSPGKNISKTLSQQQKKLGMVVQVCHSSYVGGVIGGSWPINHGETLETLPEK